jgi:hypothetical protein
MVDRLRTQLKRLGVADDRVLAHARECLEALLKHGLYPTTIWREPPGSLAASVIFIWAGRAELVAYAYRRRDVCLVRAPGLGGGLLCMMDHAMGEIAKRVDLY